MKKEVTLEFDTIIFHDENGVSKIVPIFNSLINLLERNGIETSINYTLTDEKPSEEHLTLLFEKSNAFDASEFLIKTRVAGDVFGLEGNVCYSGFKSIFGSDIPEKLYIIL